MNGKGSTVRRLDVQARTVVKFLINHRGKRRAIRRAYAYRAIGRLGATIIGFDGPGATYLVRPDDLLGQWAFEGKGFDQDKLGRVMEHLGAHGTFIDVGANVGVTTLPALCRFGFERAIAIEPSPDNVRLLRAALALNDVEGLVEVVAAGASASQGSMELELSPDNSGDHRIRMTSTDGAYGEAERASVRVKVIRLDDLDVDPADVGLLWIDAQGHEGQILAGARKFLARKVPTVIEYWPYGLRRAGGIDSLHGLIRDHFETVLDLTTEEIFPASGVAELARVYAGTASTDILLR